MKKRNTKTKKNKHNFLYGAITFVGILAVAGAGASVATMYHKVNKMTVSSGESVKLKKVNHNYKINFVIMGLDNDSQREQLGLDGTRTDSLMLGSLDTQSAKVTLYSVPRDTTTLLYDNSNSFKTIGDNKLNKINAAYTKGGAEATMNTLRNTFSGLDVKTYISINFLSFKSIVDSIGGIDIDVPVDIYDEHLSKILVHKGRQTLNGTQALDMSRARYQDTDIKRGERQQLVLQAIVTKALRTQSPGKLIRLLNSVSDNVKTTLRVGDMVDIIGSLKGKTLTFDKLQERWGSYNLGDQSMVYLPASSRADVVNKLTQSTGLPQAPVTNQVTATQAALNALESAVSKQDNSNISTETANQFATNALQRIQNNTQ